jgi:hypothetical protein
MKKQLLDILVCPQCKAPLVFDKKAQELRCYESKLAYPVHDGIPVLLIDEARTLTDDELNKLQE